MFFVREHWEIEFHLNYNTVSGIIRILLLIRRKIIKFIENVR